MPYRCSAYGAWNFQCRCERHLPMRLEEERKRREKEREKAEVES